MKTFKIFSTVVLAFGIAASLAACDDKNDDKNTDPNALTIIAGSEVKDMEPILQDASREVGVPIKISYAGTLDGVDKVKSGANYDMAWFSQATYFYDNEEDSKRIKQSEKIMLSPVIVGMRKASFDKSGFKANSNISWQDIYNLVTQKNYTYAMTDPSASNTGYSALMGVAYSVSHKTEALKAQDVDTKKMAVFFKGHAINAGSSGWLVQAFAQSHADFMVNYESVILQYNKANPNDQLVPVYPFEGIVTADYPLLLLKSEKLAQYQKLVAYLKSDAVQKRIVDTTARRSLLPAVMSARTDFPKTLLVEMPFTPDSTLSNQLLSAYFNDYKKPSDVAFVLDVSGSMDEQETYLGQPQTRMQMLKNAIASMTVNTTDKARFAQLRPREEAWLIPFSSSILDEQHFVLGDTQAQNQQVKTQINEYAQSLRAGGGTALFTTILHAYDTLAAQRARNPNYQYSVVVLTDGESNEGLDAQQFVQELQARHNEPGTIRVFLVQFGEGDPKQLNLVANATGGKVFDGTRRSLVDVFKEIRSYQ